MSRIPYFPATRRNNASYDRFYFIHPCRLKFSNFPLKTSLFLFLSPFLFPFRRGTLSGKPFHKNETVQEYACSTNGGKGAKIDRLLRYVLFKTRSYQKIARKRIDHFSSSLKDCRMKKGSQLPLTRYKVVILPSCIHEDAFRSVFV